MDRPVTLVPVPTHPHFVPEPELETAPDDQAPSVAFEPRYRHTDFLALWEEAADEAARQLRRLDASADPPELPDHKAIYEAARALAAVSMNLKRVQDAHAATLLAHTQMTKGDARASDELDDRGFSNALESLLAGVPRAQRGGEAGEDMEDALPG